MLLSPIELLPINILHIIFATTTGVGAALIWKDKTYRSLAVFFIYQSLLMILNFLEETKLTTSLHLITPAFTLVFGPLIYFVVRALVSEKELPILNKLIHLIPALVAIPFTGYTQSIIAVGTASQLIYLIASFNRFIPRCLY